MWVSVGGGILQGASVDLAAGRKAAALARRTRHLEKMKYSDCLVSPPAFTCSYGYGYQGSARLAMLVSRARKIMIIEVQ